MVLLRSSCVFYCAVWSGAAACWGQSVLLESATMGNAGRLGGASITTVQYVGWRFQVDETLEVERVGGHLLSVPDVPGDLFAAFVRLSALDAFPQGTPFTSDEVVATTLFRANFPSDEVLTPFETELTPGSYALVFGTGLFGATGEGAIHNGFDQDDIAPTDISSFIFYGLPQIGQPLVWRTNLASHMRFLIDAHVANPLGDFDFDGDVDGRDFLVWQRGGSPTALSAGDLADWQANYGVSPLGAMNVAVPEPASESLLAVVAVLLGVRVSASDKRG